MRLLIVLPSYEPAWQYGGVVSCMSILCRGLAAEGIDVTVYTTNASGTEAPLNVVVDKPIDIGGVHVWYFKSLFGSKSNFASRDLINKMRKTIHDFDVVYISAVWQWLGVSAANICIAGNVPYIIGTHGSFAYSLRNKSKYRKLLYKALFLNRIIKKATAVHITTADEINEARGWLDDCHCVRIPNAVDHNKFKAVPLRKEFRQKHNIPMHAPVIITAGRADWKKRTDLLIQALAENESWYLIVAGPTDTERKTLEWKALARALGISDRIIWPGFLSGKDLLEAYSSSDLFALVSENENFGMVVVEAMLCGLPVMVSKEVAVWALIKDERAGVSVEKNHQAISHLLRDLSKGEHYFISADQIRAVAIKRFSPQTVANQFIAATERLINLRHPN
ncbi:MAG TPA: glycosyltransferase [Smithella sp.]|nr:glycosyltransferase [Smithella sp.]